MVSWNQVNGVDFTQDLDWHYQQVPQASWPRSGLALRQGLGIHGGVIDADYRGELIVILENRGSSRFTCQCGDRIAQLLVIPTSKAQVKVEKEIDSNETLRGDQGFGSTGDSAMNFSEALWSCPKCKNGGDREHSRLPGKCKLAPCVPKTLTRPKAKTGVAAVPAVPAKAVPAVPPRVLPEPLGQPRQLAPPSPGPDPRPLENLDDNIIQPSNSRPTSAEATGK